MTDTPHAATPTLKHWRSFGASEWRHVKDGALGLVLGSMLMLIGNILSDMIYAFVDPRIRFQ